MSATTTLLDVAHRTGARYMSSPGRSTMSHQLTSWRSSWPFTFRTRKSGCERSAHSWCSPARTSCSRRQRPRDLPGADRRARPSAGCSVSPVATRIRRRAGEAGFDAEGVDRGSVPVPERAQVAELGEEGLPEQAAGSRRRPGGASAWSSRRVSLRSSSSRGTRRPRTGRPASACARVRSTARRRRRAPGRACGGRRRRARRRGRWSA